MVQPLGIACTVGGRTRALRPSPSSLWSSRGLPTARLGMRPRLRSLIRSMFVVVRLGLLLIARPRHVVYSTYRVAYTLDRGACKAVIPVMEVAPTWTRRVGVGAVISVGSRQEQPASVGLPSVLLSRHCSSCRLSSTCFLHKEGPWARSRPDLSKKTKKRE